jgi:citrate lyase subunit beta/citryl-CoA lyase
VRDLEALRRAASISASYGFDGKWALTPDQAIVLNEVYSPSQELFDKSYDILDAYRVATEETSTGAVMFGDEMIDEASAKIANSFVTRGARAGMKRST